MATPFTRFEPIDFFDCLGISEINIILCIDFFHFTSTPMILIMIKLNYYKIEIYVVVSNGI